MLPCASMFVRTAVSFEKILVKRGVKVGDTNVLTMGLRQGNAFSRGAHKRRSTHMYVRDCGCWHHQRKFFMENVFHTLNQQIHPWVSHKDRGQLQQSLIKVYCIIVQQHSFVQGNVRWIPFMLHKENKVRCWGWVEESKSLRNEAAL